MGWNRLVMKLISISYGSQPWSAAGSHESTAQKPGRKATRPSPIWEQHQAEAHAWQEQPHYCGECKDMPTVVEEVCCTGGQDNCFYLVPGNNFSQVTIPVPIYWVGSQIFHPEPNICMEELFPYTLL